MSIKATPTRSVQRSSAPSAAGSAPSRERAGLGRAENVSMKKVAVDRTADAFRRPFAAGIGGDIGQDEEWPARMYPAARLDDRPRPAVGFVQFVVSAVSIGLKDAGIIGEVPNRMCTAAVARIIEHCRRRGRSAERPVVAQIGRAACRERGGGGGGGGAV